MKVVPWGLVFGVILAGGLALAGETPEPWESVRIVGDASQVEGCKLIGEVKGKSSWGGVMQSYAESKAYQNIKRNAHKMGANVVLMLTAHSSWAASKYRGEAYLCGTPEITPTPVPDPTPTPHQESGETG